MALSNFNREVSDLLELALNIYYEYGFDPFNDLETKMKGEKVSVVINGILYDVDPFDGVDELLGEDSREAFGKEHLSRFDEGKPIPPNVRELNECLDDFVERARLIVWNAKEEKTYIEENFDTLVMLINMAEEWRYMIGEYYPKVNLPKCVEQEAIIESVTKRPFEIECLFRGVRICKEFFNVSEDHYPAFWAARVKDFYDNDGSLDIKRKGAKTLIWNQIVKEHPGLSEKYPNGLNAFRQWLKQNDVKSREFS